MAKPKPKAPKSTRPPRGPGKAKQARKAKPKPKVAYSAVRGHSDPRQRRISDELGERAYKRWAEEYRASCGWSGLADEFGFIRNSWRLYAERHDWEIQYKKFLAKTQRKTETDLVKRHAEKMKQFRGLGNATFRSLFKEIPDPADPSKNIMVLKADANVQEVIAAAKYEDELADKFPDRGDESTVTATEEEVALFVSALEYLGKEGLKAMGKLIVEKARLEKERPTDQAQ